MSKQPFLFRVVGTTVLFRYARFSEWEYLAAFTSPEKAMTAMKFYGDHDYKGW